MRKLVLGAALAAAIAALGTGPAALAQTYPTKPITLMLGFAPGGPSDIMARLLGKRMEEKLKQPIIIEHRPGAGGSIAGQATARSAPDGYTILLATGSLLAINQHLYKNVGYDSEKDFEPIGLIGTQTNVLYVNPEVPVRSLADLIALAKEKPGTLNFGSGGNGTPAHLAGELLKIEAKIDMRHVPFRGTGPALQSVIAGHVQMAFSPTAPLLAQIEAKAIRPITVSTPKRTGLLADVPTIAESGFPGFEATTWHGLIAPAGTPKPIVEQLSKALLETLEDAEVRKALTQTMGVDLIGSSPDEFRAYIHAEIPKWAAIVKASGAKVE